MLAGEPKFLTYENKMNEIRPIQPANQGKHYGFPISPERMLGTWLQSVEYHAKAGSSESQQSLCSLAKNSPDWSFLSREMQEEMEKIKTIALKGQWDPTLSCKSTKMFHSVCQLYFPEAMQTKSL